MLSAKEQKLIHKLQSKKYRWQYQMFVAEGRKVVEDIVNSGLKPVFLWAEYEFLDAQQVDKGALKKMSQQVNPDGVVGVFPFPTESLESERVLVLDGIKDPGNMGTLLRTADWFGFKKVFCTEGTVDIFNPKVVQSTMGSIARLDISYTSWDELNSYLLESAYTTFVADLDGDKLPLENEKKKLALVLGSESHGPSDRMHAQAQKVTVAKKTDSDIDSLNVAVSGGILMQYFSAV